MLSRRQILTAMLAASAALALPRLGFAQSVAGPDAVRQATDFVGGVTGKLVGIVNGGAALAEKQRALQAIVDASVAVDDVARFCLGRFWRIATPEQQKDYLRLFREVLTTNITGRVGDYAGVKLTLSRSQPREDGVMVGTTLERPNAPASPVDWLVEIGAGGPKIVDVIAEGTSLRLTQRSDYASFIARNGNNVQALIDAMKQQASR